MIADHHIIFREGLTGLLSRDPEIEIVDAVSLARDAVEKTESLKPDILLLEVNLPDGSGLDVLQTVYQRNPSVNVVFLSMNMTNELLLSGVEKGAKGYLLKDMPIDQLIKSLKAVMRDESAFNRKTIRQLIDSLAEKSKKNQDTFDIGQLTDREQEVLGLIRLGCSNYEIASALKISENTAKAHVRKILDKLHLKNRREARNLAVRHDFSARPPNPLTGLSQKK